MDFFKPFRFKLKCISLFISILNSDISGKGRKCAFESGHQFHFQSYGAASLQNCDTTEFATSTNQLHSAQSLFSLVILKDNI